MFKTRKKKITEKVFKDISIFGFILEISKKGLLSLEEIKKIIVDSFTEIFKSVDEKKFLYDFSFFEDFLMFKKSKIALPDIINNEKKEEKNEDFYWKPLEDFKLNFFLSQKIRSIIYKRMEEKKKEKRINEFKDRNNELIKGKIRTLTSKGCLVDLDNGVVGMWLKEEWLNLVSPVLGQTLFFLIENPDEEKTEREQEFDFFVSRDSDLFLKKVLELEVPEIKNGIVKIEHIIRQPNFTSKIIVSSNVSYIDPIGTCIGKSAHRIKSIGEYVYPNERVELTLWNEKKEQLILNLLLPIKTISIVEKKDFWDIVIPSFFFHSMLKKRSKLISEIEKYIKKKIKFISYQENSAVSTVNVWNGNMSHSDYLEALKNERETKKKYS